MRFFPTVVKKNNLTMIAKKIISSFTFNSFSFQTVFFSTCSLYIVTIYQSRRRENSFTIKFLL